ncbi:MAG: hypothetical protein KGL53_07095, partial [Elusimicrobia bacterium]|nr:hypothetical protein [Elusimicrobiota bacterium]
AAAPAATPADFVAAYGDCLRSAKGLSIREVRPGDSPLSVVVYSGAREDTLLDMDGLVSVPAGRGLGSFRIVARPALPAALAPAGE